PRGGRGPSHRVAVLDLCHVHHQDLCKVRGQIHPEDVRAGPRRRLAGPSEEIGRTPGRSPACARTAFPVRTGRWLPEPGQGGKYPVDNARFVLLIAGAGAPVWTIRQCTGKLYDGSGPCVDVIPRNPVDVSGDNL